jgi:predicted secreted protein
MAASTAYSGFGTILEYSTTESGSYAAIIELTSIEGPSITAPVLDVSNHDSPSGWAERIPSGRKDAGQLSIEGNFVSGNSDELNSLLGVKRWWQVRTPNNLGFKCEGILSGNTVSAPFDGKLSFTGTIDLSGVITYDVTGS